MSGSTILTPQRRLATVNPPRSLRWRFVVTVMAWSRQHAVSLAVVAPILVVAGLAHAFGMAAFPRYVDDPGTYLSQAWSLSHLGTLSPYSYFYDHAPAGWIQIALWATLTDGFDRYDTAIDLGNEITLLAKLAGTALLFALGRRLGFTRLGAAGVGLLYALCPLSVMYGRWTFLDNIATPWLLAAFVLAYSPRRGIGGAAGATLCFAVAALTKETVLVLLPVLAWVLWRNSDPRNRAHVLTVAAGAGFLLMALYPLFALYKGEFFPGPGHNSLLATARWQLFDRAPSGSLLSADSPMRGLFKTWTERDWLLLFGGLAGMAVCAFPRRLRPMVVALAIGWLMMLRNGYVPYMHVITLLPWSALLLVGAIETVGGNRRVWTWASIPSRERGRLAGPRRAVAAVLAAALAGAATVVWPARLSPMLTASEPQPLRVAEEWLADNVPRDKVLVVHDSIWVDLVHQYGYEPRPIIVNKLDSDPAVRDRLTRIDYLVLPNWYYTAQTAPDAYPTLLEARRHAVTVAEFGDGSDGVRVYRVSQHWRP